MSPLEKLGGMRFLKVGGECDFKQNPFFLKVNDKRNVIGFIAF